jgi:hypothetical protein
MLAQFMLTTSLLKNGNLFFFILHTINTLLSHFAHTFATFFWGYIIVLDMLIDFLQLPLKHSFTLFGFL